MVILRPCRFLELSERAETLEANMRRLVVVEVLDILSIENEADADKVRRILEPCRDNEGKKIEGVKRVMLIL